MTRPDSHETGVEGLRGFAALSVLYTHFLWSSDIDPDYILPTKYWMWLEFSQGAVLLFFVLSGYVIGLTNNRPFNLPNWGDYLWRRCVRLVPICWFALALSVMVRTTSWEVLVGNALFIQNNIPYGAWLMPVIDANTNVWTLNYEALYYLLFALCWVRPQAWKFWIGFALVLSVGAWLMPDPWGPLLSCYAVGWVFWLGGYGLSRLQSESLAVARSLPWISVLLFWLVTWQLKPLWTLLHRVDLLPRAHEWAWINYSFLDILPATLVLMFSASGRRPRFTRLLSWIAALLPTASVAWVLIRGREPELHHMIFCALGWLLWRWRPDGAHIWGKLTFVGSISYGLYILQRPVQWFIHDATWLPSGSLATFVLRLVLVIGLTFAIAWIAERILQPWIRRHLGRKRPGPVPVPVATASPR